MAAMDLKFKGIAWVGNIYQKFEAICQEVDNIVSQDPVKYVENQVQTGCESMKKFCSDVVQELLPPSVDPVEHEAEAVPLKQNDESRTYIKSLTGIEENLVDTDVKELPVDLDAIGPMENAWADGLSFSGLHFVVDELMPELSMNSIEGEEFSLSLGENGDVPIYENPDVDVEENFKKERPSSHQVLGLNSCGEKDLCEPSLSSEYVDENHENAQDPVKYVENQVQTGCESMKKFCSDVVQELLPPSVDPVEHEAEAVPLKQNDESRTYIKSLTGIEENLVDTDVKELPVDLDAIGPMENAWADGLSFSGLHFVVDELMPELSMNSIEGEEFSLSLGENGDVPIYENPDVDVEENFKKERPSSHQVLGLNSCGEKDLCEPSLSSEYVDENHENAQDPVKYVENQVQTGCESMKKFCSDVVQELLPPSVDPVEHEAEAVPLKQNDENRTYIKSLTGIEENLVDTDVKELPVDLDAIGPMENAWADGLSFSGLHFVVDELMPELSMNSIEGEEFSLSLGENGDVPIYENPDVDVEENFKKERPSSHQVLGLNSCGEKDLCEPSLSSEYVDENHENAQDPVKHVENLVQTGGESMKMFCSDVVQELLPPSVDPVEHEAEAVPLKQNDENRTYIKSLTGIKENLVDTDVKELPVDLDAIGPMENAWADGLSFSGLHLIVELMPELSMNSIEGEEFSLSLVENGDVPKYENPDVGVEENFKEKPSSHQVLGLNSCGEKDLYEPSFSSESVDKNHENTQVILSEVSPVCSVHDEGLKLHKELGSNCADETEFVSDYLNAPLSSELACSVESCEDKASACSVYGEKFQSLQKIGTTSGNPTNETKCISDHLSMVWSSGLASSVESCEIKTPTCSAHGEEFQSLQNVGKICSNSADETESISDHLSTLRSSELAFSVESCEKKTPGCSVHGEGFLSPQKLGTTCSNSADETDSASDPSNPLLSAEQVLSVETCGNKALVCSAHGEGFQSAQKFGTTCSKSADETDCASDPLNPLLSAEQVLLVETCENKAPACSVHGEVFQLPQKLGTSCSNSADETDCASDPSNPLLYAEQVLLVETCESKTPACSVHGEGFQSPQKLGTSCSNSADETDCASDPLNPLLSAEQVLPVETCENKAPACSVHCEGFQPLEKLGTSCSNSADETDCVSDRLSTLLSSEHSGENKIANMELVYSSNSLATEVYDLSTLSLANFPIKEEKICNPVGDALCVPDVPNNLPSFNSVPIASCLNGSAETGHASLCGVESNGLDTSKINDTAPQSGSTGNKRDQSWESTRLGAFISFQLGQSGDSGDDISGMDTIELSDKVGPEDECVFVDNKELYAVSRRLRELRSYRKRIQDAFTSKKRRAKEYEQLAIWYGDVDGGSSQNTQNLLPPSTTEQVHIKKPPTHDSCDSEWELL